MTTLKKLSITMMIFGVTGLLYKVLSMISKDNLKIVLEYGLFGVAFLWVYIMVSLFVDNNGYGPTR